MNNTPLNLQNILSPIAQIMEDFDKQISGIFTPENAIIEQISHYVIKSGGKRLRPALVFLFAQMTGETTPQHHALARAVELIHSATLVHDDIIDDADKRRGLPSIHKKWDTKSAVLAGDFLLAKALEYLVLTNNTEVLSLFSSTTQEICRGEVEQFTNKNILTIDEYIERVTRKTGMLFNLGTQGACLISKNPNIYAAKNYAINLGIAFQIVDDLLLFKDSFKEKTPDVDFANATYTLPVIIAVQNGADIDFEADFDTFKAQVKNTNAIDKSYELALKYSSRAMENLADFEDNQYKTSLKNLAQYIVEREF